MDRVPPAERSVNRAGLELVHRQGTLSASVTLADETRRALTPPLPARLTFAIKLPSEPILQFAIAVATLGRPKHWTPVEFAISVTSDQGSEICYAETVKRPQRNHWLDREVDMSSWAGANVQIAFEVTRALPGDEPQSGLDPLFPL